MIRLLYVDDDPTLLEIGKLYLERDGSCFVDTISSAPGALVNLESTIYDAIISDYEMPDMNGIELLKIVRTSGNTLPFILFTGRGREEVVIQALNEGADYYLQKGGDPRSQFAELTHKIHQAVQQRQTDAIIRDHERRESDIINFLPDATFAIDKTGHVIAWNRAIEEMTGVVASDILGKGDFEYAIPFYGTRRRILIDLIFESPEGIEAQYSHIIHENDVLIAETTLPRPQGRPVTLMCKASLLYDRLGNIIGAIESIRDITPIKSREEELLALNEEIMAAQEELGGQYEELVRSEQRIRESESRLRFMLDFYHMAEQSEKNLLTYAVEGAGEVTGSTLGYLAFINKEETEMVMYAWSETSMHECSMQDKPIIYPVEKTGLWGEAVRRRRPIITNDYQAVNPLKKGYPQGHPQIIRHMNVPIIDEGQIVIVAGVANKQTDYADTDVRELTLLMQGLWQVLKRRRAEEKLIGQYEELASTQEALRKQQEQLIEVANTVPGVIYQFYIHPDGTMGMNYVSSRAEEVFGFSGNIDNFFEWFATHVDPRDREDFLTSIDEVAVSGSPWVFEGRFNTPSGRTIWFEGLSRPVMHDFDRVYNGVLQDITGRKHAEIAMRESEEKYRMLVETTRTGFVIVDAEGRVLDANPEYIRLTGHTSLTRIIGRSVTEWTVNSERQKNADAIRQCFRDGFIRNFETHYIDSSGKITPIEINATVLQSEGSLQIHTLCRDISTRKQAEEELHKKSEELHEAYEEISATEEELRQHLDDLRTSEQALQESEGKYRTVFENTGTATVVLEENGIISLANNGFTQLSGFSKDDIEGKMKWAEFVVQEDLQRMQAQNMLRLLDAARALSHYEFRFVTKIGDIRNIFLSIGVVPGTKKSIASLLDITDRKLAEEAIRESEKKYRSVIENIQDTYYRSDRDGNLILVSPSGADLLRYDSVDEMIGKPIADLYISPEDRTIFFAEMDSLGSVRDFETQLRKKDGTPVFVSTTSHYYSDEYGKIAGVEGIIRDITAFKSVEYALHESERVHATMISNLPGFVYRCANDTNWTMEFISNGCQAITGYSPVELIHNESLTYNDLVHPDYQKSLWNTIQGFLEVKEVFEVEYPINTRSGEIRWVWEQGRGIFSDDNRLLYLEGFITDITRQRNVEEALRESEGRYRAVFLGAAEGILVVDILTRRITHVNPAICSMLGYIDEDIIGKGLEDIHPEEDLSQVICEFEAIIRGEKSRTTDIPWLRKDGTIIYADVTSSQVIIDGRSCILGFLVDVTNRKQMEEALRQSNLRLRLLTGLTRHDIMNHLTAIEGYQTLALETADHDTALEYISRARETGKRIETSIGFTREYENFGLESSAWRPIFSIIESAKSEIAPGGVIIENLVPSSLEVYADPIIRKVFSTLLENSIRHGTMISFVRFSASEAYGELIIACEDDGAGIPEDEKELIFDHGYGKNTGIGLFLAREILSITGLSIRECGAPGKGARFEILVPDGNFRGMD